MQFFNATGFDPDTEHTIATRTVGSDGDVSQVWVNHTARTAPVTSPVELAIEINPESINPNSQGTIKVTIYNNTPAGFDVANINKSSVKFGRNGAGYKDYETPTEKLVLHFNTQDTGIMCGDTQATLTGKTYDGLDIIGADDIVTTGCGGGSGGSSNEGSGDRGSNKGGNSGGGGIGTEEDINNIIMHETREEDIRADYPATYRFQRDEHWISEIVITGKWRESNVPVRIEALKGKSRFTTELAPGARPSANFTQNPEINAFAYK